MNKKLVKNLCLSGIVAVIFYLLHDIIGAMNYPGYNWQAQAVSDLTATDAPSYVIAGGLSRVYAISSCICCLMVCIMAKNLKKKALRVGIYLFALMNFVSAIGYSLFPLSSAGYDGSFQSLIHVYVVTTLVVLLSIVSLILIAVGAFKEKRKAFAICAIAAFILMFVGAIGSGNVPKDIFGIFERFSTYSAVFFTAILGIFGYNIANESRSDRKIHQ